MKRFLKYNFFSYAGHLSVYPFVPFMLVSIKSEDQDIFIEVSTRLQDMTTDIIIAYIWMASLSMD
jgi:hypothetical protein